MSNDKIIMYNSPEAAEIRTVTGWFAKGPNVNTKMAFCGDDEQARYMGCTHTICTTWGCDNIVKKRWIYCDSCKSKITKECYKNLPKGEWKEGPLALYEGDRFFFSEEDLLEYCEDNGVKPSELMLVTCSPNRFAEFEPGEFWGYDIPENFSAEELIPQEVFELAKQINDIMRNSPDRVWLPDAFSYDVSYLDKELSYEDDYLQKIS